MFNRSDLVEKALRGEKLPTSDRMVERFFDGQLVPPEVKFVTPREGADVFEESVTVAVSAQSRRDVPRMELFVNGRPLLRFSGQARVTLPNSPTVTFHAVAYDEDELQGEAEVTIKRKLGAPVTGNLHVLTVGVSKYRDATLNSGSKYAARDADAFAEVWKRNTGNLYQRVLITKLLDSEATRVRLRAALFELIEAASEKDTVVLFLAGHGMNATPTEPNRASYFFATQETDRANLADSALPWTALQTTLASVKANRVVLFLDACYAGNTLGAQQADTERMAELLGKRGGVLVFASSRGSEFSYELENKQHGAFTAALLEALAEGKADLDFGDGKDGVISVEELWTFLRQRVPKLTNNRQTPTCPLLRDFGEPFPLMKLK